MWRLSSPIWRTAACFITFALTASFAPPVKSDEAFAPLKISVEDEPLPAACSPDERQKLKSTIVKQAEYRTPLEAWQLVEHALCSPRSIWGRYVISHMPKFIKSTTYNTGEEAVTAKLIESTPAFMPEGRAWRVSAQAIGQQISISYWSSEACVSDFTIAQSGKAWLVVGTGWACD